MAVARSRLVLGALLGDRRIRVFRDGRIDGVIELEPEMNREAIGGCRERLVERDRRRNAPR